MRDALRRNIVVDEIAVLHWWIRREAAEVRAVFSYTSDAWDAMVGNPQDRAAQACAIVEAADGTVEAIYWMLGPHDWVCIFDAPNPVNSGAVSVAVGSTGPFKHLETHELLAQEQLTQLLETARECRRRYQPPAQPTTAS